MQTRVQNSFGAIHCVCSNYYVVLVVVLARHVDERLWLERHSSQILVSCSHGKAWVATHHPLFEELCIV